MTTRALSAITTVRAVALGYAPRALQARGWVLCALAVLPVALSFVGLMIGRQFGNFDSRLALHLFHGVLAALILPIMVLVAAPGGIREDLEQRTLPLILVRPVPVWILPFAKGLVWFVWGALWLAAAGLGLMALGANPASALLQALALVLAFWAELAFMSLLVLVFKRGTLWGALVLFGWESILRVLPATLQRLTFLHHIESISGSRGGMVADWEILAQEQITSPVAVSILALVLFGALCWALCGWKLQRTPVGLAGREAEG
ncbi:hypothetical protein [Mesoterricola silvestris]|uniref:Uncharacterized protein n=1 Tax=Mesoterricola silvestris TaxID=2927979 RepID=A0AA48K6M2_9BACT|nr:hypothetical protein [Mesoterricola silvestris]BDU70969.1 hypothetical protein METEAL_01430 [Mesoterricola silvestris]